MNREEFKVEFKRLCDGFDYKPRTMQVDAFFERLQHYQVCDWHEAVTDLLCAAWFPKNLDVILLAIDIRSEQRRKRQVLRQNIEAIKTQETLILGMRDALVDRPDLQETMRRLFTS